MRPDLESPFLDREFLSSRREDPPDPSREYGEYEEPAAVAFAAAAPPFADGEDEDPPTLVTRPEGLDQETADDDLLYEPPEAEQPSDDEAPWDARAGDAEAPWADAEAAPWAETEAAPWADAEAAPWEVEALAADDAVFAEAEGEISYVGPEAGEEAEGEVVLDETVEFEDEAPAARRIQARILWPALGFPAVIAPSPGSRKAASLLVDATRCLTVLVLCDQPLLSKAEAARHLRLVPWDQRGRRHISADVFKPEDLVVRSDSRTKLRMPAPTGTDNEVIAFGGGGDQHTIVVSLPAFVRDLYARAGLKHLHEIRVSEEASARLLGPDETTPFHVFWNNRAAVEDAPSDEMALLLQTAARASRAKDREEWMKGVPGPLVQAQEAKKWDGWMQGFLREYEYEYSAVQSRQKRRAEILHPVFVTRARSRPMRIAHLTDLHVDVRWDVLERNLASVAPASLRFNNCNRSSLAIYEDASKDADVVLMTGDLIDYGRGHVGLAASGKLGENRYYHRDRNWFLFYDVLASGKRYARPVYTCLGNHDWRLNPYPPFAPGAPDLPEIFHNHDQYSAAKLEAWVRTAHGHGHDARFSYDSRWKHVDLVDFFKVIGKAASSSETLEERGLPTETHIDSIAWYLLSINPFLDYSTVLPGGYRLLMLDFAKREALLTYDTKLGKNYGYVNPRDGRSRGPRALSCLTKTQLWMVKQFTEMPGRAKVIGMHVPPLGPYPDWSEVDLIRGFKTYGKPLEARGPLSYRFEPASGGPALKGHPLFALRPAGGPYGMDAEYGSFRSARDAFIKELAKPSAGVQLVFTGHIHRNGLLAVRVPSQSGKADLKGHYLMKSVAAAPRALAGSPHAAQIYPRGALDLRRLTDARAPLYVNSTSAGPLGNHQASERDHRYVAPGYTYVELAATGVIEKVAFRFPVAPVAVALGAPPKVAAVGR